VVKAIKARPDLALSQFPLIRTRSLEAAESFVAKSHSALRIEAIGQPTGFEWITNRRAFGALELAATRCTTSVRGRAADTRMYAMKIALRGGGALSLGGHRGAMTPGKVAVLESPAESSALELAADYESLQIAFPPAMMREAMRTLTGNPDAALPRFDMEADLESERIAGVARLFRFLFSEAEQASSLFALPSLAQQVAETFVLALITQLRHDQSEQLSRPVRAAEPAHLRRVEAYIEANAAAPLTLGDLAAVAGVSGRAVQAGFQALRGCSPMEFVRARRLEEARRRLLDAPPTTITSIALDCGFANLGRFAATYRARFGERPKDTLARATAARRRRSS
jgi:AraC-like DNA-binding protein